MPQQKLAQPLPGSLPVLFRVLTGPHQIAQRFVAASGTQTAVKSPLR